MIIRMKNHGTIEVNNFELMILGKKKFDDDSTVCVGLVRPEDRSRDARFYLTASVAGVVDIRCYEGTTTNLRLSRGVAGLHSTKRVIKSYAHRAIINVTKDGGNTSIDRSTTTINRGSAAGRGVDSRSIKMEISANVYLFFEPPSHLQERKPDKWPAAAVITGGCFATLHNSGSTNTGKVSDELPGKRAGFWTLLVKNGVEPSHSGNLCEAQRFRSRHAGYGAFGVTD
jgi:hypothetical protein